MKIVRASSVKEKIVFVLEDISVSVCGSFVLRIALNGHCKANLWLLCQIRLSAFAVLVENFLAMTLALVITSY